MILMLFYGPNCFVKKNPINPDTLIGIEIFAVQTPSNGILDLMYPVPYPFHSTLIDLKANKKSAG